MSIITIFLNTFKSDNAGNFVVKEKLGYPTTGFTGGGEIPLRAFTGAMQHPIALDAMFLPSVRIDITGYGMKTPNFNHLGSVNSNIYKNEG